MIFRKIITREEGSAADLAKTPSK